MSLRPGSCIAAVIPLLATVFAAEPFELPPLPSELPPEVTAPAPRINPVIRRPRIIPAQPKVSIPVFPAGAAATSTYQPPASVGDDILSWDSTSKQYTAKPGEETAPFTFAVTNISKTNVVINWVRPSCGCTAAKHPPVPWTLAPGDSGTIELGVDLRGKYGTLSKYVNIDTSHGQKMLNIQVHIPASSLAMAGPDSRQRNMQLAMADRQVVFRGDCARCHAAPAAGKHGAALYQAACAICHDAPHRATMVPDLRAPKVPTGKEYWTHWITHGKEGSLMPAFALNKGGPLTDQQIESLADYLTRNFPAGPAASSAATLPPPPAAGN